MGAERARRWRFLPFRSLSLPPPAASKPKNRPPDATVPAPSATKEEVPADFLCCPILRTPMADPVILPSGWTYERACVLACADLGLSLGPDGVVAGDTDTRGGAVAAAIPNDALRAAVRTWCARSGRAAPVAPSSEEARLAVLRAAAAAGTQPPTRSSSNLSCSSEGAPAQARSASNLSCSSEGASAASTSSSSSSGRSSREMAPVEVQVVRGKEQAVKQEAAEPVRVADAEVEVVAKAVEAGDETEVEVAMAALRRATREGAARRRALCGPRLLAALRRVLLSSRHTASARADAAAALANLSLEPENRVPVVRAGAVPALVEVLASAASPPEAREHAAGALFGLALHEGNRAAIGVLGAVPPLLAALADRDRGHAPRGRLDAGMALYHLSFAAVNQCKLARAPGASRALLSIACDAAEPAPIRRLALMVLCNVAACAEGSAALMDAGAVATASAILSEGACDAELQECCVEALYAMSRGSPRFRGLARAAGADRPLMLIAEETSPGIDKEVVQTVLRTMGRGSSDDDHTSGGSSLPHCRRVASWSAPPAATPQSSHQWRSVCID